MFHSSKVNRKINSLQERYIINVYDDYTKSFEDLLSKVNSFKIYHKNIQLLAIELFKIFEGFSILSDIYPLRYISIA